MIFFDTESCGLIGPTILIQYAENNGNVVLHEVFYEPVQRTLALCEQLSRADVCGFNLTHDWFHITRLYNLLNAIENKRKPPTLSDYSKCCKLPHGLITQYCLKPKSALDLFLYARRGPWQSLMDRRDIKIRKVPTDLGEVLAASLQSRLALPGIYFAHSKRQYEWKVEPIEGNPRFCNVVLRFKASGGLKALCTEIFKCRFDEFPVTASLLPAENLYNPYDFSPYTDYAPKHVEMWHSDKRCRSYAEQDVILLQRLYSHFGCPPPGDTDSSLACCVGAVRWKGFSIDLDKINKRIIAQTRIADKPRVNINSHVEVRKYLIEVASVEERIVVTDTSKETLEPISKWPTPLGERTKEILNARKAAKELDILSKLKRTGRFCPQFKVIGTRSGRMAGGDPFESGKSRSLNPQGIQRTSEYRRLFTLSDESSSLSGGDFESFEVTIADAAYNDSNLRKDLQSGQSFHGLLGEVLYGLPHDEILSSKNTDTDYYLPSKSSTFGILYGAMPKRIAAVAGISEESSESAYTEFIHRYPGIGLSRKIIFDAFCSMRQPRGIGTEIIWRDAPEYIDSLLGFRRYFSLENLIIRTIFELAQSPPIEFNIPGIVQRRDRNQTPKGAMQSALFACAFQMQAYNMRAAANHVIQATGAEITKNLQNKIWLFQPIGVSDWHVQPMNLHDEVLVVHSPDLTSTINEAVRQTIEKYQKTVPLLAIDWKTGLSDWSEVK